MKKRTLLPIFVTTLLIMSMTLVLATRASSRPTIVSIHQNPKVPPPGDDVNVTTTVLDKFGIKHVELYSFIGKISWRNQTFSIIDGDLNDGTWLATLPPAPLRTTITYLVVASDRLNYTTRSQSLNYTVTKDTGSLVRVTTDFSPRAITKWDIVNFTAQVVDDGSGMKNITLSYVFSNSMLSYD